MTEKMGVKTKLKIAFFINIGLLIIEVIGFFLSNSLALLGDAGHVSIDILAIGGALLAINLAARPAHEEATFGYHRAEVLSAFFNSLLLLGVSGYILYEAYFRFLEPEPVQTSQMLVIAVIGLIGNLYAAYTLHGHKDINVRGAFMHLLADTLSSGAVVVGAVLIMFTGYYIIDPLMSLIIVFFVVSGAIRLLKESLGIMMQLTPEELEVQEIVERLGEIEGINDVHDVHLWTLCSSINSFSAHLVVDDISVIESESLKANVRDILHDEFHVYHSTLEVECRGCGDETVQTICHPPDLQDEEGHEH